MPMRVRPWRRLPRPGFPRDPKYKLGGTAWDGFAYDPALDLVYFGTANAAPYDSRQIVPRTSTSSIRQYSCGEGRFGATRLALPADAPRSLGLDASRSL